MQLMDLVDLQKIDKQIIRIEESMGSLPREVDALRDKLDTMKNELKSKEEELTECRLSRAKAEGDIETFGNKLKKYQDQVYSVTTNKEYDAISTEIENTEQEIETNETQVLQLMDGEERISEEIKLLKESISELEETLESKDKVLREKMKESETESLRLQHERELCVRKVSRPLLATYERIKRRHSGAALAEVQKYSCGECYAQIPVQTVVEIRKMDHVIYCETCGRILVSVNNKK
ncbi:MAG: C4-type zinc ribbon domain-containing protein [candidate division KSB1 bacterium]|jgi:predicted  nucleic acid-binding Zn-ribbon protein|nr:C4-type zinc ribbon domain-containing protein [candidate division KSB1 bacterium]